MSCDDTSLIAQGVERCPFLRNIGEPTVFNFSSFAPIKFPSSLRGSRGPIFEDGPGFDSAFRMFHGKDGVIPLSRKSEDGPETVEVSKMDFHPLAASAATISLSAFGPGAYNFDAFMAKRKEAERKTEQRKQETESKNMGHVHEALSSDWIATGKCPIAKSCRAVSRVLPLVAKLLKPPVGMKYRCPPAVVAARAALAKTAFAKNLRPQPLPAKVLTIGLLGMACNVPLGVWRVHTQKFSPEWFIAIHAAVPFVAMMRKAIHMPKFAMAFTIAASILGQVVGARAERIRLAHAAPPPGPAVTTVTELCDHRNADEDTAPVQTVGKLLAKSVLDAPVEMTSASPEEVGEEMEPLNQQCAKLVSDDLKLPVSRTVRAC